TGVAVYAQNTFAALKARKALSVEWDSTAAETRSSEQIKQACVDAAASRGEIAFEAGAVDDAFSAADQIVEAEYTFPFLVHAPMEPLDAVVARGEDGGVDLWMGSQLQTGDHQVAAAVCGLPSEKIRIHTMLAGGSFGRRAQPSSHLTAEAAEIFMAAGGQTPVKLVWTREDDIRGGYYRPIIAHKLRGGLNAAGDIVAWEQTIAGQSFIKGSPLEPLMLSAGFDPTLVEGAIPIPYAVDNALTTFHLVDTAVPTLWWRSVGHTHTGYAVETFVDELLALGGKDAVEGRLALLDSHERLAATVRRAADMADWGRSLPEGHALGVATVESFRSYVTQIADVSLENGMPRVHKVWCAVDCGIAVNPEIVRAQMEGGIGYGLGAVLFNDLTLEPGGAVKQSNFHDYASLRIGDMPDIDVSIIASDAPPTGVGEPGTPPIGPAVANAVRRLTGTPVRHLPMNTALQS
ncbi:MAG: molybdopterin cofactor-binding domain-containing protein, partial [Pseudomonadota bacterium]